MEYTFSLSLGHHFERPSTNNLINFNRAHDNNNESEKLISRKLKLCKRSHLINGNSLRIFHFSLFIELLGEFLGEFGVCVCGHIVGVCECVIKFNYIGAFVYFNAIGKEYSATQWNSIQQERNAIAIAKIKHLRSCWIIEFMPCQIQL